MSQASSFGFPILELREIVSAFSGMEIEISENDLKQPMRERWEIIFVNILSHVTGCNQQENIFLPHLPCLSKLDHPELYENAVPLFHMTRALQRILYPCGLQDFRIADIVEPKPKRLMKICSALVNFMRFQDDRQGFFMEIKAENEAIVEQRKGLIKENEELSRQISAIKVAREEKQPEIARLNTELTTQMEALQQNQELCMEKKRIHAQMTTKLSEKRTALARLNENIATAREKGNKLSAQIVQSPERMKGEIEHMHTKLQKLEKDKADRLQRLHKYKSQKELLHKHMSDVEQAMKLINAINEQMKKEKELLTEIGRYKDSIQSAKDELQELDRQESQRKRILQSKQEKLTKLRLQQEAKVNGVKEVIENLQMEKENLSAACNSEENEVSRLREAHKKLLQEDQVRAREAQTVIENIQEKYSQLLKGVDLYHHRLGSAWDELKGQLEQRMRLK